MERVARKSEGDRQRAAALDRSLRTAMFFTFAILGMAGLYFGAVYLLSR